MKNIAKLTELEQQQHATSNTKCATGNDTVRLPQHVR